ncbi:XdhC family protein [Paenibacillus sp. TAB 01]|uniref:XdhC family protein n=1 Tax=Paenibacillus sp. TAB 01 TaxID=3368988 RepID=UPI003750EA81
MYTRPSGALLFSEPVPDAVPVANGALKAGFRVTAADWRQAMCASGAFDPAVERMVGFPAELVPKLRLNKRDYVIIMSHQLQRDQQFLDLIWPQPLAYLGILGSRFRTRQLLDGRCPLEWLRAPIGLDIGAEGAEEIAVSIVAELIYTRRRVEADWRKEADATGDSSDLFGRREELPHGGV